MRNLALAALLAIVPWSLPAAEPARPNILWISAEDISPDLGCYGDDYAVTPTIDRLAAAGVRFTRCFTHAGVCAPSRSGLITGMYPPSIGTQHMRCKGVPPADVRCFPEYLRAAGYYCTNNVKTDYQFDTPATAWDENSNQADWRGRAPGQPFFCVINFTTTHESQIRDPGAQTKKLVANLSDAARHDPGRAVVPPYYPDTPPVRRDLANYYDNLSALDQQVADVLQRLDADGLAEDTIVWFWGDHGRGLPRCKRWLYDSGTRTPLIIRVPEKWRSRAAPRQPGAVAAGSVNDQLVAFVDFAPTVLSLAGVAIPEHLQGQAFLGPAARPPRAYVYGHRDRMDEAYDLIRTVRDRRYHYFRNFRPDLSYGQDIAYMNEMPTMQELRRLHAAGELTGPPALYFRPTKPVEELFDTEQDPHELHNLADDPQHQETLQRLRAECARWMRQIGDVGLIPEGEFDELKRPGGEWERTPPPLVVEQRRDDGVQIALRPPFPGASLAYALPTVDSPTDAKPSWRLYTQPFTVPAQQRVLARAVRLGFRDSDVVRWSAGAPPAQAAVEHVLKESWRAAIDRRQLFDQLWQIKTLDGVGKDAFAKYRAALDADEPAVRYWAVWGLGRLDLTTAQHDAVWSRLLALRDNDPSPVVRLEGHRCAVRWRPDSLQLQPVAQLLREHPQDAVRLQAAIMLKEWGKAARPVRQAVAAAAKDGEYVGRVAQALLAQLPADAE